MGGGLSHSLSKGTWGSVKTASWSIRVEHRGEEEGRLRSTWTSWLEVLPTWRLLHCLLIYRYSNHFEGLQRIQSHSRFFRKPQEIIQAKEKSKTNKEKKIIHNKSLFFRSQRSENNSITSSRAVPAYATMSPCLNPSTVSQSAVSLSQYFNFHQRYIDVFSITVILRESMVCI